MLTICTWLWGAKYSEVYVDRLLAGLRRNIRQTFRFLLITESGRHISAVDAIGRHAIEDIDLTKVPGCFARLRMFDPEWQAGCGIDDRLVCVDLDSVITGPLDLLFDRPEPFVILQGANAKNPCPYNGSLMMLRAGAHPEVWSEFSLEAASKIPFHEFPDDQGWISHKIPNAAGWKAGTESGVYAFRKPGWPRGNRLPVDARLVVFPGWRDPQRYEHFSWMKRHWCT